MVQLIVRFLLIIDSAKVRFKRAILPHLYALSTDSSIYLVALPNNSYIPRQSFHLFNIDSRKNVPCKRHNSHFAFQLQRLLKTLSKNCQSFS